MTFLRMCSQRQIVVLIISLTLFTVRVSPALTLGPIPKDAPVEWVATQIGGNILCLGISWGGPLPSDSGTVFSDFFRLDFSGVCSANGGPGGSGVFPAKRGEAHWAGAFFTDAFTNFSLAAGMPHGWFRMNAGIAYPVVRALIYDLDGMIRSVDHYQGGGPAPIYAADGIQPGKQPALWLPFDWGQLRPVYEPALELTEKPYLKDPTRPDEDNLDSIFLWRDEMTVLSGDGKLSDANGWWTAWAGRGDLLLTRLRPKAFTLPGYDPPDDALSDSPPVEIDASDMNPWVAEVMTGYPDLYEPLNLTYTPPLGHHVTNDPDDDRRAQVWLQPDYEPQRAPYTLIGQAYSFPLVTGALHTAYADICVWDSENETCFTKPEGTEMPTYVMPRPSQLVLVQNPEGESVPGDGGTGGGGGTNGSWEDVHWMTLSATWFGPLTIEEQGASSSSAGTEIPHPKGVLSSMDSGENLDQLRQRLTWKLIEPANRPDLLVIEEAHVGTAPFQRVIPIARLNVGAGEMFEVELAVEGEEGDRLVLDRISILTKDPLLVPNYDRNDQIDATDHRRAVAEDVLYFWVNDNFDQSVIKKAGKQNDIPCQLYSREWTPYGDGICVAQYLVNWANDHVDSVRDLLDFFPVWVNIERMLARFPVATHQYILKQADGALNAVIFPKVRCSDVASYLKEPSVANPLKQAEVVQISSDGYLLPEAFLTQNADQRVMLFEGRKTTEHPLVLEIRSKADPNESLTEDMPLQILNVEEMFRYKNLRPESQKMYDDRLTTQLPPECFDNMTFVHVHGFQAKEEGLRGTSSTVFKRLWQTGYTGKFWYVSWDSEALHLFKGHYHNAAVNAFAYADTLATFLQGLPGPVDVGAFSLGNLLTSLAIADHNAPVRRYYAMEAAVALEAYGTEFDAKGLPTPMYDDDRPYLISPETFEGTGESYPWQAYAEEVYASEWHRLFADDPDDERRNVTWRNRLRLVQSTATAVYNFYSSTEDVLGISRRPNGILTLFQHPWKRNFIFYVWQVQELLKGLEILINIGGGSDPYAGWGFTTSLPHLENVPIFDPSTGQTLFFKTILTTPDVVKAKLASSTERAAFLALLKTDPLFRPDPEILCTTTEGADFVKGQVKDYVNELNYGKGESEEVQNVWITDWLLAKAFPARTGPLGSRENAVWGRKNNFEMTSKEFMTNPDVKVWPRKMDGKSVWWHTDYEDVAYLHVWKLYQKIVDLSKE